jgi:hypothetical protein
MRKLFWCCMTCGLLLVGSVVSTAHFAAHHPASLIGRVLYGVSYAAATINPVSGIGPLLAQARITDPAAMEAGEPAPFEELPSDPEPVPADALAPTPGEDPVSAPAEPGPIQVPEADSAPIVIREEEGQGSVHMPMPETINRVNHLGSLHVDVEFPPSVEGIAPSVMPYCEDKVESEPLPMPLVEPELLPMPGEVLNQDLGCMGLGKEPTRQPTMLPAESEPLPDGCPCNGRCPHSCLPCKSGIVPAGGEEESEPSETTVRRKAKVFKHHKDPEGVQHPEIDTMEYRPSDGSLSDYGPAPL